MSWHVKPIACIICKHHHHWTLVGLCDRHTFLFVFMFGFKFAFDENLRTEFTFWGILRKSDSPTLMMIMTIMIHYSCSS